ncbi:hypothetical protein M422DRAFT_270678 [Sphaerobolus stellatus SS14]|uniref:Uncharacterized protein n=1 Tax=Sphaerobolus stellatus (strain SS14) TaxID=990650 RepID=A0A0C9UGI1_SPHS4|nr:hypothetical protein M422DRAFT_270678 [Sphaerobolus stellatus SS14]
MEDKRSIEYSKNTHPICDVSFIEVDDELVVDFYVSDEEYEDNEASSDNDLLPEDRECFRAMKKEWAREMDSIRSLSILVDNIRQNYYNGDGECVVPELEDDGSAASPETISINGVENSTIDGIYIEPISFAGDSPILGRFPEQQINFAYQATGFTDLNSDSKTPESCWQEIKMSSGELVF